MKRAVSVSLGSSERDKKVEVELLGERVSVERRGTDGDIAKATALFTELDGQVDALGVGGIDLWVKMDGKTWNISAAHKLIQGVKQTPVVDGSGLKNTLEILIGFVPAFATFALTKDWWLLAYCGAFIWFGITGLRNILQSVLGGGGLRRSPLLRWNAYVSWDRIADSLLFTGF